MTVQECTPTDPEVPKCVNTPADVSFEAGQTRAYAWDGVIWDQTECPYPVNPVTTVNPPSGGDTSWQNIGYDIYLTPPVDATLGVYDFTVTPEVQHRSQPTVEPCTFQVTLTPCQIVDYDLDPWDVGQLAALDIQLWKTTTFTLTPPTQYRDDGVDCVYSHVYSIIESIPFATISGNVITFAPDDISQVGAHTMTVEAKVDSYPFVDFTTQLGLSFTVADCESSLTFT